MALTGPPFIKNISPRSLFFLLSSFPYSSFTIMTNADDAEYQGQTFKYQDQLPKLPVPDLKATTDRYLAALKPLQVSPEAEQFECGIEESD
jgi:hypothetical protein